jgi:hypothetical protein
MTAGNLVLGTAVHCSRFGCVVRLEDGRIANLSPAQPGHDVVKRALRGGARRRFGFLVDDAAGRLQLRLAPEQSETDAATAQARASSLDEKIIDYLRQTTEWDPKGAIAEQAQQKPQPRADRLLPFEMRARPQYRDTKKRPPRKKH